MMAAVYQLESTPTEYILAVGMYGDVPYRLMSYGEALKRLGGCTKWEEGFSRMRKNPVRKGLRRTA